MRFTPYPEKIESAMRLFYVSLSERDRRRYAAVEAAKPGHGGIRYLATLFGCSTRTIRSELDQLHTPAILPIGRARKKGEVASDALICRSERELSDLRYQTAGDPMREEVLWTNLTLGEIATGLSACGTPVSVTVVTQLLEDQGYVKRQAQKQKPLGSHPQRNEQFQKIARLRLQYEDSLNPILSHEKERTDRQLLS